jgi:glycosyl transferase family 2
LELDPSKSEMPCAMGSDLPLITVGIPTRNRSALLRGCVESVLAQTYPNIEILVSNNASTDDTSGMLRSLDDPRIREHVNPSDIGMMANLNKCLELATGEYFVLLADDNTLQPSFFETAASLLKQEPGLPIIAGVYDIDVTDEHRTIPGAIPKRLKTGIWPGADLLIEHLRGNLTYATLSCLVRTDLLRRNGGFAEDTFEEDLVVGQLLLEGRAGLIARPCAAQLFHNHPTGRCSASQDVDARFRDLCNNLEELSAVAERMVADPVTRTAVQNHTRSRIWHRAIQELAFIRQEGASLLDVAKCLWRWRAPLARCSFRNFLDGLRLRPLGRIFLPSALIRYLHGLGPAGQRGLAKT